MIDLPLRLETCTLRKHCREDAESIATLANNPKVAVWLRNAFPSPYTFEDAVEFIELAEDPEGEDCLLAIDVGGRFAGGIGIKPGLRGDVHQRTAEIGYWLGEPYWGRGVASDAVRGFADALFGSTEFLRIQAMVYQGNTASCRVLERAGFTKEGVMRRHVEKNGKILDASLYAKLSPQSG